jgi:hypothetical protein
MPEPTASAAATLAAQALAVPALTVAGMSLGIRADVLLAGWCGAIAAMALLNTVPSTGDTWIELMRTSARRIGVSVGSAVTAGYLAPLLGLINGLPESLMLSVAFVAGAGAMRILPIVISRIGRGRAQRPQEGSE